MSEKKYRADVGRKWRVFIFDNVEKSRHRAQLKVGWTSCEKFDDRTTDTPNV
jgi:hypothetical protein